MAGGKVDLYLHGWRAQLEYGKYWYDTRKPHLWFGHKGQSLQLSAKSNPCAFPILPLRFRA